jgi:hypothetical protein
MMPCEPLKKWFVDNVDQGAGDAAPVRVTSVASNQPDSCTNDPTTGKTATTGTSVSGRPLVERVKALLSLPPASTQADGHKRKKA